jgi:hypothetical protein
MRLICAVGCPETVSNKTPSRPSGGSTESDCCRRPVSSIRRKMFSPPQRRTSTRRDHRHQWFHHRSRLRSAAASRMGGNHNGSAALASVSRYVPVPLRVLLPSPATTVNVPLVVACTAILLANVPKPTPTPTRAVWTIEPNPRQEWSGDVRDFAYTQNDALAALAVKLHASMSPRVDGGRVASPRWSSVPLRRRPRSQYGLPVLGQRPAGTCRCQLRHCCRRRPPR